MHSFSPHAAQQHHTRSWGRVTRSDLPPNSRSQQTSPLPALLQHTAHRASQHHRLAVWRPAANRQHSPRSGHFMLQAPSLCCTGSPPGRTSAQPCSRSCRGSLPCYTQAVSAALLPSDHTTTPVSNIFSVHQCCGDHTTAMIPSTFFSASQAPLLVPSSVFTHLENFSDYLLFTPRWSMTKGYFSSAQGTTTHFLPDVLVTYCVMAKAQNTRMSPQCSAVPPPPPILCMRIFPMVLHVEECWCSFKLNCLLLSKHNTNLKANGNIMLYYKRYLNQHQVEDDLHRLTGLF